MFDGVAQATVVVGEEVAEPLPALFLAVTTTSTASPASLGARVYELPVAPEILLQLAPEESQSCH